MYRAGGGGAYISQIPAAAHVPARPQETPHRDSHFATNSFANSAIVARRSVIRCSSTLTPERPMGGSAFSVITSDRRAQRQKSITCHEGPLCISPGSPGLLNPGN